mgnify:CR=1 FL=1
MTVDAQTKCEITNTKGLHVRAATLLAKQAAEFDAVITVEHAGERANAKSIMNLLLLTAPMGSTVKVCATGNQADEAVGAIVSLIGNGFGELT